MIVWYIHGAGATERSFAWLRHQLPDHEARFFTYSIAEPMVAHVKRLSGLIKEDNQPCVLLGHSLGGILATICASSPMVERVISLCSPFGGIKNVEFLAMFSLDPLVRDMREHGPVLSSVRAARHKKPHMAIVGTNGLPFLNEANDGAITVASQMALQGPHYVEMPLNHFEVLLSDDVAGRVADFIS